MIAAKRRQKPSSCQTSSGTHHLLRGGPCPFCSIMQRWMVSRRGSPAGPWGRESPPNPRFCSSNRSISTLPDASDGENEGHINGGRGPVLFGRSRRSEKQGRQRHRRQTIPASYSRSIHGIPLIPAWSRNSQEHVCTLVIRSILDMNAHAKTETGLVAIIAGSGDQTGNRRPVRILRRYLRCNRFRQCFIEP